MTDIKTAIYARQSVEKKDSISIDTQIDLCKASLPVGEEVEVYLDRGYSGKNVNRPAFIRLMNDVEQGLIHKVCCYRIDRISRSIADFGHIWDLLSQHKVEFSSVNENFDTSTPIGRAMLYIIMVFAQLERETVAERIKDNYYDRVKKGAWPGGPAPYGFTIVRQNHKSTLAPNEHIEVVKEIFSLYALSHFSLRHVALLLNEKKISCARRKAWDSVAVGRIIRNPVYAVCDIDIARYYKQKGIILANDPDEFTGKTAGIIIGKRLANERKYTDLSEHVFALAEHTGVIPSEQFLICQYKMDENKQIKNSGKGKYTWLSGLLKCAECGYSLKVVHDTKSDRNFLVCSGRTNLAACSLRHSERLEDVEAFVSAQIIDHAARMVSAPQENQPACAELSELKIELTEVETKIQKLITALGEANQISMKYINTELSKLDQRSQELSRKIDSLSRPTVSFDASVLLHFDSLSFEAKKAIAQSLIFKVATSPDETSVEWRV